MIKLLRVAVHEYRQHVFNKRFLMGLLSVPLVMLVMVGLVYIIISMENDTRRVGYVDRSGLLADPRFAAPPEPPERPVAFLPFASEDEARAALIDGTIQAYYLLPEDYLSTGSLTVVHMGEIKPSPRSQFYAFLGANLLRDTDPELALRLTEGAEVTVISMDGSRSASEDDWFNVLVPMIGGLAFILAMFSTGGYLQQAVVEEKENRTMEVIITSVSPNQFMTGKIIGDIAIGLTQILVWALFVIVPILIGRGSMSFLRAIQLSPQTVTLLLVIMLPSFVLVSALMAAVGATVTEASEAQQVTGLIAMPIWIPYMLTFLIMQNPNSPLSIALSLLPMTAPMTMLLRDGITILPAWQIALSAAVQVASAVGGIWLAGRTFRLGMLLYGKRLRWREVFARQKRSLPAASISGRE